MEYIIITGANGFLGIRVIKEILSTTEFGIFVVVSSYEKYQKILSEINIIDIERLVFISNDDFINEKTELKNIYGAVHLAFARRNRPPKEIADSLNYTSDVFRKLANASVNRIINISSQGVYGNTIDYRTESTLPAPENHYTMAKYASELLFETHFYESKDKNYTNLRLDIVAQTNNLIPALCKQAIKGRIELRGGKQVFSFIDASDAAKGIVRMLLCQKDWDKVYNLGLNKKRYTLVEIANIVSDVVVKKGYNRPIIKLDSQDISLWAGMNSEKFISLTGWEPICDIYKIVENCLIEVINNIRSH